MAEHVPEPETTTITDDGRRLSAAGTLRSVDETLDEGAGISVVARRAGAAPDLLHRRRSLMLATRTSPWLRMRIRMSPATRSPGRGVLAQQPSWDPRVRALTAYLLGMSEPSPARLAPDELVRLQRCAVLAGLAAGLTGPRDGWLAPRRRWLGQPETFSDAAIQFCLNPKLLFGLALRQTIGMVTSLLKMAGLAGAGLFHLVPEAEDRHDPIPFRRSGASLNLLVDSTGVKMQGHGEWQVRGHGPSRRRQWRKANLAMDMATGDIRAVEFTPSREGDSLVLPSLLAQIPPVEQIGTFTVDDAYDTRKCHTAIVWRGATATIPIHRNGRA